MAPGLLARAIGGPSVPDMRLLPPQAVDLLVRLQAPPRLGAHLRAVHDVAWRLTGWLAGAYPKLEFDRPAVLFGAATHDIGKVVHPEELSGPGSRHESAGRRLLLDAGVDPALARFAGSHGTWDSPAAEVEDLLVSVADNHRRSRPGLKLWPQPEPPGSGRPGPRRGAGRGAGPGAGPGVSAGGVDAVGMLSSRSEVEWWAPRSDRLGSRMRVVIHLPKPAVKPLSIWRRPTT